MKSYINVTKKKNNHKYFTNQTSTTNQRIAKESH